MPVELEPLRRVKCTFKDCANSFVSDEQMRHHKKREHEFEYCHRCDEDFKDYNDLIFHKIIRPNEHKRACRVCGDEFASTEALKRHIELNHKVKHTLTCPGCQKAYYRPVLFIEHLESNYCSAIPAQMFVKHIIHKQITYELLHNKEAKRKFDLKQAKYDATQDLETEGGISLEFEAFDDEAGAIEYTAIEPEVAALPEESKNQESFPPLPSQMCPTQSKLATNLSELNLIASTTVGCPAVAAVSGRSSLDDPIHDVSSINGSTATVCTRRSKLWGSRTGQYSSNILFADAKPTPVKDDFSIIAYDQEIEKAHGVNAWKERFWDPDAEVYNAERFYDAITTKYDCPFVCDQNLDTVADLNRHIRQDHKIDRMKCLLCCRYFQSATALMAHCETLDSRCKISKTRDFGIFLDRFTGGFLEVKDVIRPDHLDNPAALVQNAQSGRMEPYRPPVASYLRYNVSTPPDYKQPMKTIAVTSDYEQ